MTNYKVVEIFSSINGEGIRAGQLAVFVRMQGCNLNCTYCDTKWANEADAKFHWTSTEEILELLRSMEIKNVTITGGEPLLQEEIGELLEAMAKEENLRVEIETKWKCTIAAVCRDSERTVFYHGLQVAGQWYGKIHAAGKFCSASCAGYSEICGERL